jgi:hypothetical protein
MLYFLLAARSLMCLAIPSEADLNGTASFNRSSWLTSNVAFRLPPPNIDVRLPIAAAATPSVARTPRAGRTMKSWYFARAMP